jgi:hypothetical protein
MKSLFAFSSGGGGGSGFPGAPIAGVYTTATAPEFLSVCAEVLAFPNSIVVDFGSGGLVWYSNVTEMKLLGGSVTEIANLPTPGAAGGVTFAIDSTIAIYNQFDEEFYTFDGASWSMIG